MRLFEFTELRENVSFESSIKIVVDILTTELPELYRRLGKMAENYSSNHGEIDKGFNFIAGGIKSTWYNDVVIKSLRPSLYNLLKHTPKQHRHLLDVFLNATIGQGSMSSIEHSLIPALGKLGVALKSQKLQQASSAAKNSVNNFYNLIERLNNEYYNSDVDGDIDSENDVPAEPNVIGQQNIAVDGIINDVLSRIDRRVAGEIRNAIARSDNKLAALQQELRRRGINL
jgi:hypothetical protein